MVGKRVKGYSKLLEATVTGVVMGEGCYHNSYVVDVGNLILQVADGVFTSELIFFEEELTEIN